MNDVLTAAALIAWFLAVLGYVRTIRRENREMRAAGLDAILADLRQAASVTTARIENGAVTVARIKNGAVRTRRMSRRLEPWRKLGFRIPWLN